MIKRFLAWLKSIYFKPAVADIKTPEVVTMSEALLDQDPGKVEPVAAPGAAVSTTIIPAVDKEVKAGVADFEAALSFVESGVAQLGEAAKEELKELAKKYL